ncbi:hypothetical protein [Nannocystis punicea]|uniref:Uncharacterized protein n=1 Tax=Nannocystis punicea TaxID=2995304 RepID=A0ABY7GWY3_9BACT|nr:hypothetical protein [Nannocystis poenicansa]WAS91496.1 hypothetical protein O0S08_35380 [Nannocystis poenicansa]
MPSARLWVLLLAIGCGSTGSGSTGSGSDGTTGSGSTTAETLTGSASTVSPDLPAPVACSGGGDVIEQITFEATTFVVHGQAVDTSLDAAIASIVHQPCMVVTQSSIEVTVGFGPIIGVDTESLLRFSFINQSGEVDLAMGGDIRYFWHDGPVTRVFDFLDPPASGTASVSAASAPGDHFSVHLQGQVGTPPEEWTFDFTIDAVRP